MTQARPLIQSPALVAVLSASRLSSSHARICCGPPWSDDSVAALPTVLARKFEPRLGSLSLSLSAPDNVVSLRGSVIYRMVFSKCLTRLSNDPFLFLLLLPLEAAQSLAPLLPPSPKKYDSSLSLRSFREFKRRE